MLTARGDTAVVAAIKLPTQRVASAYNLTVDDIHTYYVAAGEHDVLVHNACQPRSEQEIDERGKPIRRVYEHNPKHGPKSYTRGNEVVSRAPRGNCQAILDCSVPKPWSDLHRLGIEPSTGRKVELRRHLEQYLPDETVHYYHGYVPEG